MCTRHLCYDLITTKLTNVIHKPCTVTFLFVHYKMRAAQSLSVTNLVALPPHGLLHYTHCCSPPQTTIPIIQCTDDTQTHTHTHSWLHWSCSLLKPWTSSLSSLSIVLAFSILQILANTKSSQELTEFPVWCPVWGISPMSHKFSVCGNHPVVGNISAAFFLCKHRLRKALVLLSTSRSHDSPIHRRCCTDV